MTLLTLTLNFSALLLTHYAHALDIGGVVRPAPNQAATASAQDLTAPRGNASRSSANWSFTTGNDSLVSLTRDEDYSAGFALAYSGDALENAWFSLDTPLAAINKLFRVDTLWPDYHDAHSFEVGMYGFTPDAISFEQTIDDDRPYASLVYTASSRQHFDASATVAWHSNLSIGVLGLGFIGDLQNGVHRLINRQEAVGWSHQISAGGEPTLRYSIARQELLDANWESVQLKSSYQASLGYITEATVSFSLRAGRLSSPWWSFNPELASYGEGSAALARAQPHTAEQFFWAGVAVKGRAYNAFLQGQFRDSDVTYAYGELNHLLLEVWMGYTFARSDGYRLSYMVRGHTSEVEKGKGNRRLLWGGLVFSKTFD